MKIFNHAISPLLCYYVLLFITQKPRLSEFLLMQLLLLLPSSANKDDTVQVDPGIYKERIFVPASVVLLCKNPLKAVIDGNGRATIVTLGTSSTICGFEIRNGTIGVFSTSSNSTITQCRIVFNQQSGIMCVGNLPRIEDNIIAYNRGSEFRLGRQDQLLLQLITTYCLQFQPWNLYWGCLKYYSGKIILLLIMACMA